MEVIRDLADLTIDDNSFLHVCGGDPVLDAGVGINYLFSPRMWR